MKLQNWWFTTLMNIDDKIQPPLTTDNKTDFLVIGGGAAGLSAAYSLLRFGPIFLIH